MTAEYEWGERLPTLTGARVALRSLVDADVPALFDVFSDPEVMRYLNGCTPTPRCLSI